MMKNNVYFHNELGSFNMVENCQKVSVNELIRKANKMLKNRLVEAQIEALGMDIELVTSKTRFNGERIWFKCPKCCKRVGTLFNQNGLGCRKCDGLIYRKQRYKGMKEII